MNIKLILDYMGTAYHGWQRQSIAPTVQATLEDALEKLTGVHTPIIGCGRTDAGVHARGYAANFRSDTRIPLDRLPLALNSHLPDDIVVRRAEAVPDEFHAVFSCAAKEYTYTILNSRFGDPFQRDRAVHIPSPLNFDRMRECAAEFMGEHDFAAVRSTGGSVKTTVRTVYEAEVKRDSEIITIRIKASGFLYNMARAMAGTIVYAGLGKLAPGDIIAILDARDRTLAGPTLEARGLCMTGVWYGLRPRAKPVLPDNGIVPAE